jgi:hypothetical protein
MPRRLNLVNLLRSISMAKTMPVCGQPATVRVEANLNGRNSTMLLCDDHYRQLVRQQKRTVSPLEALFGSRSAYQFEDFLGSDFFRIGEDATPVAADTDDVVDASFGEPATAGSGAPAVAAVGWPAASANSRKPCCRRPPNTLPNLAAPRWIPNICCWRWPTATWSRPSWVQFKIKVDDL